MMPTHAVEQAQFIERQYCIACNSTRLHELSSGRYHEQPLKGFINSDPWGINPSQYLKHARWVFVECLECHQKFHKFILNSEWNQRKFSDWMSASAILEFEKKINNSTFRQFERGRAQIGHILCIEKLTQTIRDQNVPVKLLDFGCGWGEFLTACQGFGFNISGIDRAKNRRDSSRVPIYASIADLPAGESFHAITMFEVLEHVDEPLSILRQLHNYLLPDGILILETPDCSNVQSISEKDDYYRIHPLEHINAFTHKSLKEITRRAGFRPINRGTYHVNTDYLKLLKSMIKNSIGIDQSSTQLYFRKI